MWYSTISHSTLQHHLNILTKLSRQLSIPVNSQWWNLALQGKRFTQRKIVHVCFEVVKIPPLVRYLDARSRSRSRSMSPSPCMDGWVVVEMTEPHRTNHTRENRENEKKKRGKKSGFTWCKQTLEEGGRFGCYERLLLLARFNSTPTPLGGCVCGFVYCTNSLSTTTLVVYYW